MRAFLLFFSVLLISTSFAQLNPDSFDLSTSQKSADWLYLSEMTGKLKIEGEASHSTFQAYFVIPLAYVNQAPLWFEIDCDELINYKFIHLDSSNIFVSAQLYSSPDTINLNWTSWMLNTRTDYSEMPDSIAIPDLNELPEDVKSYLKPTACVQWEDPFIQNLADSIKGDTDDLIELTDRIADYVKRIPEDFQFYPASFDAYYALKYGNLCTGHAHAAAALLRANGIPCRVLLTASNVSELPYTMHWIVEYFIPDYGWVKMETSAGTNPYVFSHRQIVTFACKPEDEFSLTNPDNLESYWFTSDTVFQHFAPNWFLAHQGRLDYGVSDTTSAVKEIIRLATSAYKMLTEYQGIELNGNDEIKFKQAKESQLKALNHILSDKRDSLVYYLEESLIKYHEIDINEHSILFFDDFENENSEWNHGGIENEWERGNPSFDGFTGAYSGTQCWGTDLDNDYNNSADNWLTSPIINLDNLLSAYLSIKIWNDVEDDYPGFSPKDKFWIELSTDNGESFIPITTHLGGVIDYDNGSPQVGGWSRLVLDLTPFINHQVMVKFRFTSDEHYTRPGSFIDDFLIYGRRNNADNLIEYEDDKSGFYYYPIPSKGFLYCEIPNNSSSISVFDLHGKKVLERQVNKSNMKLDLNNFVDGIYFVQLITNDQYFTRKIVLQK